MLFTYFVKWTFVIGHDYGHFVEFFCCGGSNHLSVFDFLWLHSKSCKSFSYIDVDGGWFESGFIVFPYSVLYLFCAAVCFAFCSLNIYKGLQIIPDNQQFCNSEIGVCKNFRLCNSKQEQILHLLFKNLDHFIVKYQNCTKKTTGI